MAIAIAIGIEGGLYAFIDTAIAVVVGAITELCCIRVGGSIRILAVSSRAYA
jgi:hypothetical protein